MNSSTSQLYSQTQGYSNSNSNNDISSNNGTGHGSGSGSGNGPLVQLQGRLHTIKSKLQATSDMIDQAMQSCTVAAIDLENDSDAARVGEVDAALRRLLDAQYEAEVEEALVAGLATTGADPDTALAEYVASKTASRRTYEGLADARKYGGNARYRDFRQQIWDTNHEGEAMPAGALFGAGNNNGGEETQDDEDDDLVISGARLTYRCPLTATWLIDPVTSKACGHSFSNTAITDYLRSKGGSCVCPSVGCRSTVGLRDLFPDKVLERKVANRLRRLEEEEEAATYTLVQ
ncbi:hypothetical protein GGI11_004902 [Coemansia sp. RSA 2049]|nr:hypothetical protein H4217_007208 [Coemansia sp. RSA 1939]KAJ2511982.1 hypothetical protein GGI11_004902 [Coemansia sp. RSA 2049]KAJ2599735.1 hypothetical protein EV177_007270 [Coemansia sp. RSA 1804]KAJ2687701.1 hypothetical protein GGH99_003203 [Coemansia sp. RSA 1285]